MVKSLPECQCSATFISAELVRPSTAPERMCVHFGVGRGINVPRIAKPSGTMGQQTCQHSSRAGLTLASAPSSPLSYAVGLASHQSICSVHLYPWQQYHCQPGSASLAFPSPGPERFPPRFLLPRFLLFVSMPGLASLSLSV